MNGQGIAFMNGTKRTEGFWDHNSCLGGQPADPYIITELTSPDNQNNN